MVGDRKERVHSPALSHALLWCPPAASSCTAAAASRRVCCNPHCLSLPPAGWWCWLDAVIYQKAVVGEGFPFKYSLPGIVATLALILMNLLSRDQLNEASESGEEGADVSAI